MSVIKTKCGWVEMGAANPLQQAFEAGASYYGAEAPKPIEVNRQRVMPVYVPVVRPFTQEDLRRAMVNLADKVHIGYKVLPNGKVRFGKYGPTWDV